MKKFVLAIAALLIMLVSTSCGAIIEEGESILSAMDSTTATTTVTTTTISIIDAVTELDSSSTLDSSSLVEDSSSLVETATTTTTTKVVTTTAAATKETTTTEKEKEEYIVYKPSTHYIHKSSCHWVTSECYKITNTKGLKTRKCSECNPNMKIVEEYIEETTKSSNSSWSGPILTRSAGTVNGPSGKETYYNLDMSGVVSIMRNLGYDSTNYPYWVRSDGCKMLGDYIMCAANLSVHPRGTLVLSSLGTCIVCDTGGFAYSNSTQLDIATTW
jgi:hypothetical protein